MLDAAAAQAPPFLLMERGRLLASSGSAFAVVAASAFSAFADPPPAPVSSGRLFGTDEAPAPAAQGTGPHVVMRLAYTRMPGAEACPEEQFLRDAVAAKVPHYAPFAPNAPWRLQVEVAHRPEGFAGFAELRDVTGTLVFRRDFGRTLLCADLLDDLARAIGIRVDPPVLGGGPPPPGMPAPLPPPVPVPPPAASTAPVRDETALVRSPWLPRSPSSPAPAAPVADILKS